MPELNIQSIEEKWRLYWEKEKIFAFNPKTKKKIFSIDTPPPTVSGDMHIGHAFSYSQQDFIVRFKRMSGFEVFYPFGTDDNGLPTERLVEKLKKVKSKSMPRTAFIKLCLKTLKEITPSFIQNWKNLGISADYSLHYSTINSHCQKISQSSFVELYNKSLIYLQEFPTIWCPECQTPIAQAELEDRENDTIFSTLLFKVEGKDLPIATTRPELLPACVAVFVNPGDKRYKRFIGKNAIVPLFQQEVPIIADTSAQIDKGTGALMICSYGDKYDVEAVKHYKLAPKIILKKDGTLAINPYNGLKIKEARTKILEDLKAKKLILKQESIKHNVNTHDKCGTEIEFLPTEQWFIKILKNRSFLIEKGKKIIWHPEHMLKRFENWINGLEWDWSISRERHFGIPIPAWQCRDCKKILLAEKSELPLDPMQKKKHCPDCKKLAEPEHKVLDTWATSSLTPQIASSLIKNKIKLPFSLRPQAHDIIRTWAFYTIVKAYYHEKNIPWKHIIISGNVSLEGEKMSKSKGNLIEPKEVIKTYGADALRYWAAGCKLGEDLGYQEKDLVAGKRFINKILNAASFITLNLSLPDKISTPILNESDRLFLTQLNKLIHSATKAFNEYNYSKAKLDTEQFFWHVFADNYLELVKHRIYQGTESEKISASYTLYKSLLTIIKLMAPFTPFIMEEIYQTCYENKKNKSIHLESWPLPFKIEEKKSDSEIWNKLLYVISFVRQKKSEAKKSMKAPILLSLPKEDQQNLSNLLPDLKAICTAKELKEGPLNLEFTEK